MLFVAICVFFLHIPKEMVTHQTLGYRPDPVLGTYADRLETLANVREAGISVFGHDVFDFGSFARLLGG